MAYYLEPQANDLSKLNNGNTQDVLGDVNSSCNKTMPEGKAPLSCKAFPFMLATHTSGSPQTLWIKCIPIQPGEKSPNKSYLTGVRTRAWHVQPPAKFDHQ